VKTPLPVAASIAQRPGYGGHAWAFLQFALGFEELGYEPVLIDRLAAEMAVDADGEPSAKALERGKDWFVEVTAAAGLEGRCALLLDDGSTLGIGRERLRELVTAAPLVLDVMGFLADPELCEAAQMLVFLDVDPGFTQIWQATGEADLFGHHDRHVTVGANIGSPACPIPTCGFDWIPISPPVVLSRWPASPPGTGAFRSVATWRGPYDPVWYEDRRLGLRVHEFRRFADLPTRLDSRFELALDIDAADARDAEALRARGWSLLDPAATTGTLASYAEFIRSSGAEISIAKNIYVETGSGWFSDRSACFLASGRPVLAQDTGWSSELTGSPGLVPFATPEEAVDGARMIEAELAPRGKAARSLAENVFDSRKVLNGLLAELQVN
jgi:hypothetical protein